MMIAGVCRLTTEHLSRFNVQNSSKREPVIRLPSHIWLNRGSSKLHFDNSGLLFTSLNSAQNREDRLARLQEFFDLLVAHIRTPNLPEGETELFELLPKQVRR